MADEKLGALYYEIEGRLGKLDQNMAKAKQTVEKTAKQMEQVGKDTQFLAGFAKVLVHVQAVKGAIAAVGGAMQGIKYLSASFAGDMETAQRAGDAFWLTMSRLPLGLGEIVSMTRDIYRSMDGSADATRRAAAEAATFRDNMKAAAQYAKETRAKGDEVRLAGLIDPDRARAAAQIEFESAKLAANVLERKANEIRKTNKQAIAEAQADIVRAQTTLASGPDIPGIGRPREAEMLPLLLKAQERLRQLNELAVEYERDRDKQIAYARELLAIRLADIDARVRQAERDGEDKARADRAKAFADAEQQKADHAASMAALTAQTYVMTLQAGGQGRLAEREALKESYRQRIFDAVGAAKDQLQKQRDLALTIFDADTAKRAEADRARVEEQAQRDREKKAREHARRMVQIERDLAMSKRSVMDWARGEWDEHQRIQQAQIARDAAARFGVVNAANIAITGRVNAPSGDGARDKLAREQTKYLKGIEKAATTFLPLLKYYGFAMPLAG